MAREIVFDIDEQGNIKIETKGFAGHGCKDATKDIESALGVKTSDKPTAEAFTKPTNTIKQGS